MGTAHLVITRDIDEGWVNIGCYRVMVHDKDTLALYISPGKQGRIIRQKYFDQGRPCPVAISFGDDPLLLTAAANSLPWGKSEYDYAGGIRGQADRRRARQAHRLADSGLFRNHHRRRMSARSAETRRALRRVDRLLRQRRAHRTDHQSEALDASDQSDPHRRALIAPTQAAPMMASCARRSSGISMEKAGVPDVRGVGCYQGRFFTAVSIKQRYPGHAKQAGVIAAQCGAGAYLGRYIVVVDDDIDPYDINDVMWAMCTRSDPANDTDFIRRAWSGPLDPVIPKDQKGFSTRAIIDATRPYEWMKDYPLASGSSTADEGTGGKKIRQIFLLSRTR